MPEILDCDKHYMLYSNCIPVRGYLRSVICDLQREKLTFIPNVLCDFLISNKFFSRLDLFSFLNDKNFGNKYIEFLERNQFLFECRKEDYDEYPPLNLAFNYPFQIESAIIDISSTSTYNLKKIFIELTSLNCRHLQIRDFGGDKLSYIFNLLSVFKDSLLVEIEILAKYKEENLKIINRLDFNPRVSSIILFSHPDCSNRIEQLSSGVYITGQNIFSEDCCGIINSKSINSHIKTFTKGVNFNSCLYKKIGIDKDGYIKNCPAMVNNFGHIDTTTISEAIESKGFARMGKINKDQINVCKNCEFRYNCSDCRAFVKGEFDVPTKCEYNPYICKWKGEEGYLTLEECGVVSSNNEIEIDHDKIKQINSSLWQE